MRVLLLTPRGRETILLAAWGGGVHPVLLLHSLEVDDLVLVSPRSPLRVSWEAAEQPLTGSVPEPREEVVFDLIGREDMSGGREWG